MQAACCATGVGPPCSQSRLCPSSRASAIMGARGGLPVHHQRLWRQQHQQRGAPPRAAPSVHASAAVAQPLVRAVGRLAARALGSGALLNLARSARGALSGRAGPLMFAGLLAYSVAVTLYAAQASRNAAAASASSSSAAATLDQPLLGELGGGPESDGYESAAEAVAASAVADLAQPPMAEMERKLQKARAASAAASSPKKEERAVCKVCGGSGQVAYENHMQVFEGTVCPCCLGKGTVKNPTGNLISCLLSFDP